MDYEYGYDYEKAIKDRLKAANDAFINDPEPQNRRQKRVSFDNAVIAFETQTIDEMNTIPDTPTHIIDTQVVLEQQQQQQQKKTEADHDATKTNTEKIPLNDTVEKEHPDEFRNKLKEIVAQYDADHNPEIKENVTKHVHMHQEDKEDDESEVFFMKYKPVKTNSLEEIPNINEESNIKQNSKSKTISFDNPSAAAASAETIDKNNNLNNVNNNIPSTSNDLNKTNRPKSNSPNLESPKPLIEVKKFSFNAPERPASPPKTNTDHSKSREENNVSRNSPVELKVSDKVENVSPQNGDNEDRVLIERDGKFMYVDSEEYTAIEKARKALLEQENKTKANQPQQLAPHPPTRPKTSNGRNVHRGTPESSKSNPQRTSPRVIVRKAHSADGRSRSERKK